MRRRGMIDGLIVHYDMRKVVCVEDVLPAIFPMLCQVKSNTAVHANGAIKRQGRLVVVPIRETDLEILNDIHSGLYENDYATGELTACTEC